MNPESEKFVSKLIPESYAKMGLESKRTHQNLIRQLLEQRKLPANGWPIKTIESLLSELSLMDSNNFVDRCGVGEREGRVISDLVAQRHFGLSHGIGRSGDISAPQPKAAGSSLLSHLANSLVLDLLKALGLPTTKAAVIIPCATGMSLMLCLLALRRKRTNGNYVIFPRIDQKSCVKSIVSAGFEPIVVEPVISGDELCTNIEQIKEDIERYGPENIVCVMSTTSCFAPRVNDNLIEISKLCASRKIPHIVNNAYGLQCTKCLHQIEQATRIGRVDVFVQSTDKNLLVPVGGSIIAGIDRCFIQNISSTYPGRGSSTPSIDVLITLLQIGKEGYLKLVSERKEIYIYMKEKLNEVSMKYDERLLKTTHNGISMAMTLNNFGSNVTEIGSMLYKRLVCGSRVVLCQGQKEICGIDYTAWGSHCNIYPHNYITSAAALGTSKKDVDVFIQRLDKILSKCKAQNGNSKDGDKCDN